MCENSTNPRTFTKTSVLSLLCSCYFVYLGFSLFRMEIILIIYKKLSPPGGELHRQYNSKLGVKSQPKKGTHMGVINTDKSVLRFPFRI